MYVRYFGKAPSVAEIAKYNDFKTPKLILEEIIGDADDSKATLTTKEFVNNAFQKPIWKRCYYKRDEQIR